MRSTSAILQKVSFAISLILLVLISLASIKSIANLFDTSRMLKRTTSVIQKMEMLIVALKEAETVHRRFIVTGDNSYVKSYKAEYKKALSEINVLESLVSKDTIQQKKISQLLKIIQLRISENVLEDFLQSNGIILRRLEALEDTRKLVREMEMREYELLTHNIAEVNQYSNVAPLLSVLAAFIVIGITVYLYRKILKDMDVKLEYEKEREMMSKRDEFLTIASHELKTPLTSMKGYLQIALGMLSKDGDTKFSIFIQKANKQADRITMLVRDILTVSKINENKINYHFTEFDIADLTKDTVAFAQQLNPIQEIELKGVESLIICADKNRIEQVFQNLVSNALKFSKPTDKIIFEVIDEGENVKFSITDFGIGIPKEKQANLFNRFFRIDEKNYNTTGLGIGLYIANEIITRHKGSISVYSVPGEITTFSFVIPKRQQQV